MIMFKVFLLPYWIWRTNPSPYATQITAFSAPLWSRYTCHLRARTAIRPKVKEIASPVALDTNSSPLFYRNLPNIRSHTSIGVTHNSSKEHTKTPRRENLTYKYTHIYVFTNFCEILLFIPLQALFIHVRGSGNAILNKVNMDPALLEKTNN